MKSSNIFKSIFLGEYVEILLKISESENSPVMQLSGYLLDLDNDYYFLGKNGTEITDCVQKNLVGHICIIDSNPAIEVLNKLPITEPENGN